jgi:hypothetical protein
MFIHLHISVIKMISYNLIRVMFSEFKIYQFDAFQCCRFNLGMTKVKQSTLPNMYRKKWPELLLRCFQFSVNATCYYLVGHQPSH